MGREAFRSAVRARPVRDIVYGVTNALKPEQSSTGLSPDVAAALSYLAWWVSGLFFLLIERDSRFVRFHAAQALVGFGAIWLLGFLLWVVAFLSVFASATLFTVLLYLAYAVWAAGIVAWVLCVLKAWQGDEFELPLVGPYARRLSNS